MVALANGILTDITEINKVDWIIIQWAGERVELSGPRVRAFIYATNQIYKEHPEIDCLTTALELVPPPLRPVLEYLYNELKEVIE